MARLACALLVVVLASGPLPGQKKPDPKGKAKPESAPAAAPAVPLDPELKKELDAIETDLGAKINCVPGKNFDLAGTINTTQLELLMEVADRAYKIFEDLTADAGGVVGERVTGASPLSGKSPAELLFAGRKCLILIFSNGGQFKSFGKWYESYYKWPVADAMKSVTYFPIAYPRCVIASHLRPHDINMMRNVVAHEIGHMVGYRYAYNNNFSPVWFVEGLATCIEGRALGTTSCYCFSGGYGDSADQNKSLVNREWSKWKSQIKAMAKAKQDKAMTHIMPMQLSDLAMNETGKAMAMVDFWMKDPAKLTHWLGLTKKYWPTKPAYEWEAGKGEAQTRALKEAFGMDWQAMDEAWRQWVLANY